MTYTQTVRCDFKGCKKKADVDTANYAVSITVPEGWKILAVPLSPSINGYGAVLHYCPLHADLLGVKG